ncbi:MAG: hypothetical protein H0X33_10820 [Taibaiella sp.]|nr:hypothetical protein [Taibaiella sp.]
MESNMMQSVLEILKYTIPALVVLLASYLIVQKFVVSETQRKQLALLHDTQDITLRLRLQAYERLVLFVERLHPRQLIPRVYESSMTVLELQQMLIFNIKTEFEHNLSQQLYVSKQVWDTVKSVKEQEINMISNIAQQLKPDAPAKELHMRMVDYILTTDSEMPTDIALHIINDEAKQILQYGPGK